ncbi:MAG: hypothetical protein ACE5IF_06585 [Candidatus Bathyarchaeia archaeon]
MKKMRLGITTVFLVMLMLLVATASAAPKWYREDGAFVYPWISFVEKKHMVPWFEEHPPHRASDPLLVAGSLDLPLPPGSEPPPEGRSLEYELGGWVTFICESQEGFEYSIDVKGLDPRTMYDVVAFDVFSATLVDLGDISTDKDGEGEIEGVIEGLSPGFYVYAISVNLEGTPILQTLPPYTFYDSALDAIPIPELPMPLGVLLWTFGDSADFEMFP